MNKKQSPIKPLSKTISKKKRKTNQLLTIFLAILVIITFILGYRFKGLIIVAKVNQKPVYSWQFAKHLWRRFGQKAIDDLILERLVESEAEEVGIKITPEEVEKEIAQIKEQYSGQSNLETVLQEQGISWVEFEENIARQLVVEKLLEKKVSITDQEITAYITQNAIRLQATDEASQKEEALNTLKSQKMTEAFDRLFPELKEKGTITKFLKF